MTATSTRKTAPMTDAPTSAPHLPPALTRRSIVIGLLLAVVSAATFATAGPVAKSVLVEGWSPAAAVTTRVTLGALILAVPTVRVMRGRWAALRTRRAWVNVGLFGLLAVGGCQLFYFLAVRELSVGVALMLEYLGPILVVGWLWLAHRQPPRQLTLIGVGLSLLGLLLVLDVLGDVRLSTVGVMFGLLAAVGLGVYFVVGADESTGLPPIAFSCLGMAVGAAFLALAGLVGLVPFEMSTSPVVISGASLPWWAPILWLGIVAAALAYATGIAANRRLGAKVASFVGLTEVMFAVLWAWLLLSELPAPIQLLGGALILAGVLAVKADERPDDHVLEVDPIPTP